jgi:hypothetical protein
MAVGEGDEDAHAHATGLVRRKAQMPYERQGTQDLSQFGINRPGGT